MKSFDVYPLFPIEPVKASACSVTDRDGNEYLDLYGGHAVISIGHTHPHYVEKITNQLNKIGFYSNSVLNSLQQELSDKLGALSGYDDYNLFLCNSGAEANENALKLASFVTEKKKVIAFKSAFHGRTSAAVRATDNAKIVAPINEGFEVVFLPLNDIEAVKKELVVGDVCAIIIEGIQGVGGVHVPEVIFLEELSLQAHEHRCMFIVDEIQSGYGRSGKFFAHQYAKVKPHLITTAKGMGNGFPVAGVLIHPSIEASYGMLGTTFGGNHLACAASIAVLDILKEEQLIDNALQVGNYLLEELIKLPQIKEVRGQGLMIGLEFETPMKTIREDLLFKKHIFTGASGMHTIRLLPPLCLTLNQATFFVKTLKELLQ